MSNSFLCFRLKRVYVYDIVNLFDEVVFVQYRLIGLHLAQVSSSNLGEGDRLKMLALADIHYVRAVRFDIVVEKHL